MAHASNKRVRLIDAAKALIHKQGFHLTTLADIAQEANVPLGNVYYYFKTKEAIAEAVIEGRRREILETLQTLSKVENIRERLLAYVQYEVDLLEQTKNHGCPIGGLCQELAKHGGPLANSATKVLNEILVWVEKQFEALGMGAASHQLAVQFVANIQGTALLTHTLKDPKILPQLKTNLSAWLEKIAHTQKVETCA